jgi:hypothetical protein
MRTKERLQLRLCIAALIVIICHLFALTDKFMAEITCNLIGQYSDNGGFALSPESPSPASSVKICPHTLWMLKADELTIRAAIERSKDFHERGGSLKSIQDYLNRYIDQTYNHLGLKFKPKGQDEPMPPAKWLQDYVQNHTLPRNGYNNNLPGGFDEGVNLHLLGGREVLGGRPKANQKRVTNILEPFSGERFQVAMGPMGPECTGLSAVNEKVTCQGWDHNETDDGSCHVFSIGGNNEWAFEELVIKQSPHCIVHTFDCTLREYQAWKERNRWRPRRSTTPFVLKGKPKSESIRFYPYCIGDKPNPNYKSYSDLLELTGIKTAPRILKMDVEGYEYSVIPDILAAPPSLWPEQIIMEVHWASRMADLPWVFRAIQASEISLFFSLLFSNGGYLPVYREFFPAVREGPGCPSCMEVILVKTICTN